MAESLEIEALSASGRNRRRAEILAIGSILRGDGIAQGAAVVGRALSQESTWIRLTGGLDASGGYPWAEVWRVGGAWATTGRTGSLAASDAAYHINADSTLSAGSAVYRARRSRTSGEWIFWRPPTGPTPGCASGTVTFFANGCANGSGIQRLPGATVTFTGPGGSPTVTGTTGSLGTFSVNLAGFPAGTYSYSITHPRFVGFSASVAIGCSPLTLSLGANLAVASGYRCIACAAPYPYPEVLRLYPAWGAGPIDITYDPPTSQWLGTNVAKFTVWDSCLGAKSFQDVLINWSFYSNFGTCTLSATFYVCNKGIYPHKPVGAAYVASLPAGSLDANQHPQNPASGSTSWPLSMTFNYSSSFGVTGSFVDADNVYHSGTAILIEPP